MDSTPVQTTDDTRMKHYAARVRVDNPDLPKEATDTEILKANYQVLQAEAPGVTPDEYWKVLGTQYGEPAPVAPKVEGPPAPKNAWEAALQNNMKVLKGGAEFLKQAATNPIGTAVGIGKSMAEGANSLITVPEDMTMRLTGHSPSTVLQNLPMLDTKAMRERGYDEPKIEHLLNERKRVANSLLEDIKAGNDKTTREVANGVGLFLSFLTGPGAGLAVTKAGGSALGAGLATSAGGAGGFMGGAAAASGADPQEILNQTLTGITVGGALHGAGEGVGALARKIAPNPVTSGAPIGVTSAPPVLNRPLGVNPGPDSGFGVRELPPSLPVDRLAGLDPNNIMLPRPPVEGLDTAAGTMSPEGPRPAPEGVPLEPKVVAPENTGSPLGQAPGGWEPPAVQGPIGAQEVPFTPPEGVKPMSGLVGNQPIPPGENALAALKLGDPVSKKTPGVYSVEGTNLGIRASGDGQSLNITHLATTKAAVEGQPAPADAALTRVHVEADRMGVPVDAILTPAEVARGGKVPLDELKAWYGERGYQIVDEGDGWAQVRRQPVPQKPLSPAASESFALDGPAVADRIARVESTRAVEAAGNVVEGQRMIRPVQLEMELPAPGAPRPTKGLADRIEERLTKEGDAAALRLNKSLGGLKGVVPGAIPPGMLRDAALVAASHMYRFGLRSARGLSAVLVEKYGDSIAPHVDRILAEARKILQKNITGGPSMAKQIKTVMDTYEAGTHTIGWYKGMKPFLQKHFGEDWQVMARFITATSYKGMTESNISFALKAYGQWKLGLPFEGYLTRANVMGLEAAARGEVFGDLKAQNYLAGLLGDPQAMAFDRMVMRAFGRKSAGMESGPSSLSKGEYEFYSQVVRDIAGDLGVEPVNVQEAIWGGQKTFDAMVRERTGGQKLSTKTGSFRFIDDLLQRKLAREDGSPRTPAEWVDENRTWLRQLNDASESARLAQGPEGGVTVDPVTLKVDKSPGYIVTIDQRVIDAGAATGSKLVEFRKRFADLIEKYPGIKLGNYQMLDEKTGQPNGQMSQDFNILLPDNPANLEAAIEMGLQNRQQSIGHIGADGSYTSHRTGYDSATHGPQFASRTVAEIDKMLEGLGVPSRDTPAQLSLWESPIREASGSITLPSSVLERMVNEPAMALEHAAAATGLTHEQLKAEADAGNFKPMTDAGIAGMVSIGRGGLVWQFVDPVKEHSYNTMALLFNLRGKDRVANLDKLNGLEIHDGFDNLAKIRGESGYIRLSRPDPVPGAMQATLTKAMLQTGGEVVPLSALDAASHGTGLNSFWMLPNGRLIRTPWMHMRHAELIAKKMSLPNVKGFEGTGSSAGSRVQALLNMGVIRIQAAGTMLALDIGAKITPMQRASLKETIAKHEDWAAQISDEKGNRVSMWTSTQDKSHHFLAKAGGEE